LVVLAGFRELGDLGFVEVDVAGVVFGERLNFKVDRLTHPPESVSEMHSSPECCN
jgi:hypothetical protein